MSLVKTYIKNTQLDNIDVANLAYIANLEKVAEVCPEVSRSIVKELKDQRNNLKLIASENYSSYSVQLAMGNLLTDKYAEGFPRHRFYAGCDNIDDIEGLACDEAKKLFDAEHAYVQPHSGADANLIAFWAILRTKIQLPEFEKHGIKSPVSLDRKSWNDLRAKLGNQRIYSMDLYSGGHLTHGYRMNISGQMFDVYSYGVDEHTGLLDYDKMRKEIKKIRPLIFLVGYSSYPRKVDFAEMKKIADEVGAILMVDMAHFAGLVAGKVFTGSNNPIPYADVVTSTTHKTLRGPRGGLILCKKEYAESVDKGCPLVIGGPIPQMMAAKAVAFREANSFKFQQYAKQIVKNSKCLAESLINKGMELQTEGTDNHLLLLNLVDFGITGLQAERALMDCAITLNRNALPLDPNGPWYTSGLRIGTPAVTTLGMDINDMEEIADLITNVIKSIKPRTEVSDNGLKTVSKAKFNIADDVVNDTRYRIEKLLHKYTLYPELDIQFFETLSS